MQLIDSPLKMCLIMYLFSTATDNKGFKGLKFVTCRWQLFGTTMFLQWKRVKTGHRLVGAGFCSLFQPLQDDSLNPAPTRKCQLIPPNMQVL